MVTKLVPLMLVALGVVCLATAQTPKEQPMTNADVTNMVKAGISESTIVLAIRKGPTRFETDPDALIKLKRAGVTEKVLATMLNSAAASPQWLPETTSLESTGGISDGDKTSSSYSTQMRVGKEELTGVGEQEVDHRLLDFDKVNLAEVGKATIPGTTFAVVLALADKATQHLDPDLYRDAMLKTAGDRIFNLALAEYHQICGPNEAPDCVSRLRQQVASSKFWLKPYFPAEGGEAEGGEFTIAEYARKFPLTHKDSVPRGGVIDEFAAAAGTVLPPPGVVGSQVPAASTLSPIEEIRGGPHQALPPAQAALLGAGGGTSMLIGNDSQSELTVYFAGPTSQVNRVAPKSTQVVVLEPGHYEVAAKLSNAAAAPFYGVADYAPDTQYSEKFNAESRSH